MRKFPLRRRPPAALIALLVVGALIAGRFWHRPAEPPALSQPGEYRVRRVVDGDTLLLDDGNRVRLIGVDTPETKHPDRPVEPWGPEASAFTRDRVEGESVRLEFDKERRDRHGRILAYVYYDESHFLNEELISEGLGRAITRHPYSAAMKRKFRKAEAAARDERLGIWSTTDSPNGPVSK